MHLFINDKFTCSSAAVYGTRNEGGGGEMGGAMGGHSHGGAKGMAKRTPQAPAAPKAELMTVASMSDCEGPWKVKKGDTVVLKAEYDLKKHPL
jgi:hypothetical protein